MLSRFLLFPTLALAAGFAPLPADARDIVASAGASTTSTHDYVTGTLFVDGHGARRRAGRFTWQPMLSAGWIDGRDRPRLENDAFVVAAGTRLVDWWRRAFVSFQFGISHDTNDALSSHGQFLSSIGWEGDRVVYTLRHISNGKVFPGPNLGETMLLVGLRF
ncbi:lipid A 3-O-deacylase [Pseudofulvimonas gallinarii]|uniref:Lipid A 3-O-deacylase PagL n=2 Tax=Pseudofulvimonas gallinarii TaxID=634155 RepID=A0A4R3L8P7_9GAMM|nr:lipid A 3-O-deacylase [Pseudofulvimonas gallinarii]TCS96173.1 hypothetical protein EDC25_11627 [Pseudofulvimonas gallinarii]